MNTPTSTPRLRPVIRVFVSSTFSDMKHEPYDSAQGRLHALAAEVYPKLEELCQKNGFQFQAIDLRWGVSTEAGLDHRTCILPCSRTKSLQYHHEVVNISP